MNELKWYQKILIVLLVIVFLPLIAVAAVGIGIDTAFHMPKRKKKYKSSRYYADFKQKFTMCILDSSEYRFYNSAMARKLPIQYTYRTPPESDYFIFDDTLFLLPDFDQIDWNEEKAEWQVDYDGDWVSFDEVYEKLLRDLDHGQKLPVKLLVERNMFPRFDLNQVKIPTGIFLTRNYEDAFENEDSLLKMVVPQNSKELYQMMLQTPDLCGKFELVNNEADIEWCLDENIKIEIGFGSVDCYLSVQKRILGKVPSEITHWHPSVFEIYDEVCNIGKRGNVLVISSSPFGASVLYSGKKEHCPYSAEQKHIFRKLYYWEAV